MAQVRIRPAISGDCAALVALWNPQIRNTSVTFTTEEKSVAGLAADIAERAAAGQAFLVAEENGIMLGLATYFQFRRGPGYRHTMEHTVILSPDARGRGVGRALMTALENHAARAGVHSLIAGVSSENPGGVAFHERLGYRRIAELPEVGFKFGRWMDLIVLQKLLRARADNLSQSR